MTRMVKVTRKKSHRIPGYIIICLVICIASFSPQLVTIWKMNQQIKTLETKKHQLLSDSKRYKKAVKDLKSNEMVEKLAREELGMIKPGRKGLSRGHA